MDTSRFTAYCTARIFSATGDGPVYSFSVLPSGDSEEIHFPFLTGASVVFTFDTASQITITFDAPFEEGMKILESGALAVNNILEVSMGYHGTPETTGFVFGSMMGAQDGIEITPEGVTGTITANIGPDGGSRYKRASQSNDADFLLSNEIIARAIEAGFSDIIFEGESERLVEKQSSAFKTGLVVGLYGILNRLKNLARVNWFTRMDGDGGYELVLIDMESLKKQKPSRAFVMRGGLFEATESTKFYPIISFSPEIKGFTFSPRIAKARAADIGADGEVVVEEATSAESEEPGGASMGENASTDSEATKDGTPINAEPTEDQVGAQVELGNPEATTSLDEARQVASSANNFGASLVTVGLPSIPFGTSERGGSFESIELLGVSIFSGIYQIKSATHTWSGSGIETSLEIFRNFSETNAGTNTQTAD